MERKFIEKPAVRLPLTVGIVGVFSTNYSSSVFFADAFEKLSSVKSVIRFDYRRGLNERTNFIQNMVDVAKKVDLMIIMKGSGIPLQAIKMCTTYCTTLFWMMDIYTHFSRSPMMLENSVFCDYRTATGYGTCRQWEDEIKLPVKHIIDGSDTKIYYPSKLKKQYDVSFIGGSDKERDSIYNFLKNKYRTKFFGPKYSKNFVRPEEFRQICCRSHIVLNISRGTYEGYSSLRLWNLLACGSMVLTKKIPKMTEYMGLEADKDIVEFSNFVELSRKIDYYLKNSDKRKEIETNGLEFLKNNRTWTHSASEIINLISEQRGMAVVPDTPGLVVKRKQNRTRKVPKIHRKIAKVNKQKKIPTLSKEKLNKKVGVSRRVKAGWITA